jgi:hypothetical protein
VGILADSPAPLRSDGGGDREVEGKSWFLVGIVGGRWVRSG